jgi:IclR family acetate operon transcriptional repressor
MKTKRSEKSPEGSVRAVERVLDLLTALERFSRPASLTEISGATGLHKATAQRLLMTLERRGFVQKERGLYQLGLAIVPLSRAFLSGNSLVKSALPVLEELVTITGETASLYVRHAEERILIQRVESPSPLRFVLRVGERQPIYSGSTGQVLCAAMPEEQLRELLDRIGEIRLANGKTLTEEEIYARLEQVRRQGFAVSVDERLVGISSVAAPIVHPDMGVIASVVVTGPSSRLTAEKIAGLSNEVRRAARDISERYSCG